MLHVNFQCLLTIAILILAHQSYGQDEIFDKLRKVEAKKNFLIQKALSREYPTNTLKQDLPGILSSPQRKIYIRKNALIYDAFTYQPYFTPTDLLVAIYSKADRYGFLYLVSRDPNLNHPILKIETKSANNIEQVLDLTPHPTHYQEYPLEIPDQYIQHHFTFRSLVGFTTLSGDAGDDFTAYGTRFDQHLLWNNQRLIVEFGMALSYEDLRMESHTSSRNATYRHWDLGPIVQMPLLREDIRLYLGMQKSLISHMVATSSTRVYEASAHQILAGLTTELTKGHHIKMVTGLSYMRRWQTIPQLNINPQTSQVDVLALHLGVSY